jgi:hypothetical protein
MGISPDTRAYLAAIGSKGGAVKHPRKGFGSATPEARRSAQKLSALARKSSNRKQIPPIKPA